MVHDGCYNMGRNISLNGKNSRLEITMPYLFSCSLDSSDTFPCPKKYALEVGTLTDFLLHG